MPERNEHYKTSPLRGWAAVVNGGADAYDRGRYLSRIFPRVEACTVDAGDAGRRRLLAQIARALRAERNRGRAGHWAYDLSRQVALAQAYTAERRLFAKPPF